MSAAPSPTCGAVSHPSCMRRLSGAQTQVLIRDKNVLGGREGDVSLVGICSQREKGVGRVYSRHSITQYRLCSNHSDAAAWEVCTPAMH